MSEILSSAAADDALDANQQEVLIPGRRLVLACPGAGKTRAIVARYLDRMQGDQRGKALLSFTNRAVDEARLRCKGRGELLSTPNFAGTFDSFIQKFVVTPWYVEANGRMPNYVTSYKDSRLTGLDVRHWRVKGTGMSLWNFRLIEGGAVEPIEASMDWRERTYWTSAGSNSRFLLEVAYDRICSLVEEDGFIDCETASFLASQVLSSAQGQQILERLALRFSEVIVDEAQDCDKSEIDILIALEKVGMNIVIVADPNQAIFGFRGGDLAAFYEYAGSFANSEKTELINNYRSSDQICSIANSIARGPKMVSTAKHDGAVADSLFIIQGSDDEKAEKFLELLERFDVKGHDAIVLASRWASVNRIAGRKPTSASGKYTEIILRYISEAASLALPPRERAQRVRQLEGMILELFQWDSSFPTRTRSSVLSKLERNDAWIRAIMAEMIVVVRQANSREGVAIEMRKYFVNRMSDEKLPLIQLGNLVKKPSAKIWNEFVGAEGSVARLLGSSIHSAKGGEWDAVLYDLTSTDHDAEALRSWRDGDDSEPARVMYVAMSRAKRVLALSESGGDELQQLLQLKGLSFEVI